MGLSEYLFGKDSEDRACEYIKSLGFQILQRNFRSKFGEIDIVAVDKNDVLCFIEVKASGCEYDATFRLTPSKYNKILKAINFYMLKHNVDRDFQVDFLVINKSKFELIRNISL